MVTTTCREAWALEKRLAALCAIFLSACGGGGSTTPAPVSQEPPAVGEILGTFTDGSGVLRTVATNDDTIYFFINDITDLATTIETSGAQSASLEAGNLTVPISGTLSNLAIGPDNFTETIATLREDPTAGPLRILEATSGEAFVALLGPSTNPNAIFTRGSSYGTAPAGSHEYRGAMATHTRSGAGQVADGQFTLSANFDSETYTFAGFIDPSNDPSRTVTSSGTLDLATGRIQATTTTVGAAPATMYGSLHGSTAGAVSGVFHSNEASPVTVGAFAGSRP